MSDCKVITILKKNIVDFDKHQTINYYNKIFKGIIKIINGFINKHF